MIEQPPRVVHARHPAVKALDEGRYLDRMVEVLGPGEWMVPTEHGFWWSPWRTRHQVEMVAGADGAQLCRSTFVLVVDVHHEVQALNMANYVNQVSVGGACWYDAQAKELKVTSLTTLAAGMWSAAFVFEQMVQRMVGVMERIAPWLALECEGVVPEPQHPTLGLRSEPDQLVREWAWSTEVPEAACGVWWSQREVQGFKRAARFMVAGEYGDQVGAQVDPLEWHEQGTATDNLSAAFVVERNGMWARLALQEGRHPDFGFGPEFHFAVSEVFGTEDAAADEAVSSVAALEIGRAHV